MSRHPSNIAQMSSRSAKEAGAAHGALEALRLNVLESGRLIAALTRSVVALAQPADGQPKLDVVAVVETVEPGQHEVRGATTAATCASVAPAAGAAVVSVPASAVISIASSSTLQPPPGRVWPTSTVVVRHPGSSPRACGVHDAGRKRPRQPTRGLRVVQRYDGPAVALGAPARDDVEGSDGLVFDNRGDLRVRQHASGASPAWRTGLGGDVRYAGPRGRDARPDAR